jgi:TRAP-type C4-dicarboxylate transport system permease small subunit
VDIFDRHIGVWGRFLGDLTARSIGSFILFLLIEKTWDKALDAHEYGDVTNMIEIPVWIAYGAITIGMGGYAIVLVVQLLAQLLSGVKEYE